MLVQIRFFAVLRQAAGVSQTTLELPEHARVADTVTLITQQFPGLSKYISRIAYAVNQQYASADAVLNDGDELALIPPVSGGSDDDWISILSEPIDPAPAIAFVSSAAAGGINIFLGVTRKDANPQGRALLALEYETYEQMALKQLRSLATRARENWPIVKLVILHRVGRVGLGEASVLIAVACPHRSEAFDACRWLIDMVKKEAAIWKKEIWQGGAETWSGEKQ